MAISKKVALSRLDSLVAYLGSKNPSKAKARSMLASLVSALDPTAEQALMALDLSAANTREEVMDAFAKANPDLSKEELEAFADNWEKNKDVVKDKAASTRKGSVSSELETLEKDIMSINQTLGHIEGWKKKNLSEMMSDDIVKDYARDLANYLRDLKSATESSISVIKDMMDLLHDQGVEAGVVTPVVAADPLGIPEMKEILVLSSNEIKAGMKGSSPRSIQTRLASLLPRLAVRGGPVELEIPAVWESGSGDPVEVLISGMVSPVSPATRESPAEGGVESITMKDKKTGKSMTMSRDDKDWAADLLMDAAKKKHMILRLRRDPEIRVYFVEFYLVLLGV